MDPHIIIFSAARKKLQEIIKYEREMEKFAHQHAKAPDIKDLRPAEATDIVIDAIIWYLKDEYNDEDYWQIVDEVLRPNDLFKGYCGHDGCRYGLDRAMVEKE